MRHDWIDWISFDEWVRREAEQPKGSTVIHGNEGRIEINGKPIGTVAKWSIDYDRAAERGKQMSKKQRIEVLEREVKALMGTVEQLREQQRSNSSAVRSAIVSIADHQREHVEGKAHQDTLITPEQREVRNQLMSLRTLINELRAEMQKSDRDLGEIITNNRNHAILDKRQAEQQLAAVQVQLAGLKEWAELTDTAESAQNERLIAIGSELRALKEWASLSEQHNEKLNHLELEQPALSYRLSNMRCAVSLGMYDDYDDLRERVALVEKLLDTPREQTNPTTTPTLSDRVTALEDADPINFTRKACAELSAQMVQQVTDILNTYITPFKQRLDAIATLRQQADERLSARVTHLENGTIKPLSEQLDTLTHAVNDLQVERARSSVLKSAADDRTTETQAFTVRLYNDIERLSKRVDAIDQVIQPYKQATEQIVILRERLEHVEQMLATKNEPQGNQLYQLDPTYGYVAVEPPVWYGELPALLQSLRSEIDALISGMIDKHLAQFDQIRAQLEQARDRVESIAQYASNTEAQTHKNDQEIKSLKATAHTHLKASGEPYLPA